MKPIEWTEKHRREALRRTYEIAAELASAADRAYSSQTIRVDVGSEAEWRACLGWVLLRADPARIDREVRRVDHLARGVLVRETRGFYRVRAGDNFGHECVLTPEGKAAAKTWIKGHWPGARVVKVTTRRIRRAP
jgi:hypothetical protein